MRPTLNLKKKPESLTAATATTPTPAPAAEPEKVVQRAKLKKVRVVVSTPTPNFVQAVEPPKVEPKVELKVEQEDHLALNVLTKAEQKKLKALKEDEEKAARIAKENEEIRARKQHKTRVMKELTPFVREHIQNYPVFSGEAVVVDGVECCKPLATRIHKKIIENLQAFPEMADVPASWILPMVRWFLTPYTAQLQYQQGLAHIPHRYDLQGNPVGEVTQEDREAARARVVKSSY